MTYYIKVCCPIVGTMRLLSRVKVPLENNANRCHATACGSQTFMLDYRYKACRPGIKEQVVDMALNGSGIRDTARVLGINKGTVISTLKKSLHPRPGEPGFPACPNR